MTTAINKANNIFNTINDNFSYLNNKVDGMLYSASCPALNVSNGSVIWNITHNLNTENVVVSLYDSLGQEQLKNVSIASANSLSVTFKSYADVTSGSYKIIVKG